MKQQFSEMGQQDMQGDKYLDTFETQSMAALVISLEYTQDLIQRGEIQAESLFYVSAASTGPWAEHNESDLAHVVSTHLPGPRPTVITMVLRKDASGWGKSQGKG